MGGRILPSRIEYAAIAQSAERVLGKDEVRSSNLRSSSSENPHGKRLARKTLSSAGFHYFYGKLYLWTD